MSPDTPQPQTGASSGAGHEWSLKLDRFTRMTHWTCSCGATGWGESRPHAQGVAEMHARNASHWAGPDVRGDDHLACPICKSRYTLQVDLVDGVVEIHCNNFEAHPMPSSPEDVPAPLLSFPARAAGL